MGKGAVFDYKKGKERFIEGVPNSETEERLNELTVSIDDARLQLKVLDADVPRCIEDLTEENGLLLTGRQIRSTNKKIELRGKMVNAKREIEELTS